MLCIANVGLSDWPLGQRRDVDPANEKIQGLLRAGYIVPLVLPRRAPETPSKPSSGASEPSTTPDVVTPERPARATQKRRSTTGEGT